MLELIFKFPEDRPPFIGVVFYSKAEAEGLNHLWIKNHNDEDWELKAELDGQRMYLILFTRKLNLKYTYEIHKYNQHQLLKFISETQKAESFNFGHIIKDTDGSHKVVKTTFFLNWVLKCCIIEIYQEF